MERGRRAAVVMISRVVGASRRRPYSPRDLLPRLAPVQSQFATGADRCNISGLSSTRTIIRNSTTCRLLSSRSPCGQRSRRAVRATCSTSVAARGAFSLRSLGERMHGWSASTCLRPALIERAERGVDASVAEAEALDYLDRSFDLVICSHVIEHVVDDVAVARELARVTRNDGLVYIEAPQRLRGGWYPYRLPRGGWGLDPTHMREYASPDELVAVCQHAGLEVLDVVVTPLTFPLGHLLYRTAALVARRRRPWPRGAPWARQDPALSHDPRSGTTTSARVRSRSG